MERKETPTKSNGRANGNKADRIQRSWPTHADILALIARQLANRFAADFGLICLVDTQSGALKTQVVHDQAQLAPVLGEKGVRELAHIALEGNELFPFRASTLDLELPKPLENMHLLVLPVGLGANQPRGVVVLRRGNAAFTPADRAFFGQANMVGAATAA